MCIYLHVLVSLCVHTHLHVCMNKHVEIQRRLSAVSSPLYFTVGIPAGPKVWWQVPLLNEPALGTHTEFQLCSSQCSALDSAASESSRHVEEIHPCAPY